MLFSYPFTPCPNWTREKTQKTVEGCGICHGLFLWDKQKGKQIWIVREDLLYQNRKEATTDPAGNIWQETLKERQDDEPEKGKETDFCSHGGSDERVNNAVSGEYDGI